MNVGIIGGGAIATFILDALNKNEEETIKVGSVYVRDEQKYNHLREAYKVDLYTNMDDFLASNIDVVVEAANIEAVNAFAPRVLQEKDLVLISIGALADEVFLEKVYGVAEKHNRSIYLPSGGIGGLDILQSANALGGVKEVSLTTRKPAASLIDEATDEEIVVYEGPAAAAIKKFPKNINVSIILSLAGIGTEKTKVTIIADPNIDKNTHTIDIKGDAGHVTLTSTNNPLPSNPKSSYLAALSIVSTLKKITNRLKIGL